MAADGNFIIFYRYNLFIFYFVSTDERSVMGSQPNLASRSEVVSIYKCFRKNIVPQKGNNSPTKKSSAKNIKFGPLCSGLPHSTAYLRKEASHRQTKMLV